jgi:DNA helicase-2/ATP-dependent DNA helicase PcrA
MKLGKEQHVLLGPPGTGKTTNLLGRVEQALNSGLAPEEIAFVSFTRKAVQEAVTRACQRFNLVPRQFPFFQTVHAMCFRQLGCTKNNLLNRQNYKELGDWLGYDLTGQTDMGDGVLASGAAPGDKFLFLDNLARARGISVKECWEDAGFDIAWYEQERFSDGYKRFKERQGLMDFTDLLLVYTEEGKPASAKLAFVDEAQDLSFAQWGVLTRAFSGVPRVIVAGDDDQSIYKWSGADLNTFLHLDGTQEILSQSYRLPKKIHEFSLKLLKGVKERYEKRFAPTDETGSVEYINELENVIINPEESTMILGRNVYLLQRVYEHLGKQGVTYTGRGGFSSVKAGHVAAIVAWERLRQGRTVGLQEAQAAYEFLRVGDCVARGGKAKLDNEEDKKKLFTEETLRADYGLQRTPVWHEALQGIPFDTREYYISVLRAKRKISSEPLIHVNTIHGVKGGEADHVIIMSDMSKRTFMEYQKDTDSEHRVSYVAATRAKKKLTILMPNGSFSFPY